MPQNHRFYKFAYFLPNTDLQSTWFTHTLEEEGNSRINEQGNKYADILSQIIEWGPK